MERGIICEAKFGEMYISFAMILLNKRNNHNVGS